MFQWTKKYKMRVSAHCTACTKKFSNIKVRNSLILALKFGSKQNVNAFDKEELLYFLYLIQIFRLHYIVGLLRCAELLTDLSQLEILIFPCCFRNSQCHLMKLADRHISTFFYVRPQPNFHVMIQVFHVTKRNKKTCILQISFNIGVSG